jgi:hypothetical protein
MLKPIALIFVCFSTCLHAAGGAAATAPAEAGTTLASAIESTVDTAQMERDLQRLDWKQFRSIVEKIPKLKAGVDAYGPAGWDFVRANYRYYGWKKNIDRLDATQKNDLAKLIAQAKRRSQP